MRPDSKLLSLFKFDFAIFLDETTIEPIVSGLINNTYKLCTKKGNFILQKINTNIFKDPVTLMENIKYVTEHIRSKAAAEGADIARCTLEIVKSKDGALFCKSDDGACWRCYKYIENSVGLDTLEGDAYHSLELAGSALGKFQQMLMDFDASRLVETIPSFHDTKNRFKNLETAIALNLSGRKEQALTEIEFALQRKNFCGTILDEIEKGSIPLRVTHNDTKLSNILADANSGEVLCFIDLDTVMPGSALYDFGDALRSGAASGAEDEPDLDKIYFVDEAFEAFCRGYLSSAESFLTEKEIELLPESVIMMTFECGIRFLSDFLDGDTYFSTKYPEHNLVRARTQFKLVEDMERKLKRTKETVKNLRRN